MSKRQLDSLAQLPRLFRSVFSAESRFLRIVIRFLTAFSTIFDDSSPDSSRSRNLLSRGNDENDRRIDPRGESASERTNNYNYVNYVIFLFFPLETNKYTRSSISIHLFPFSLEKFLLSKKFLLSFIRVLISRLFHPIVSYSIPPPFLLEDFYLTKTKHRRGIRSCH